MDAKTGHHPATFDGGSLRQMPSKRRRWPILLPISLFLSIVVLYCLLFPKLYFSKPWILQERPLEHADASEHLQGHDVYSTNAPDDFTFQLHPKNHIDRPSKRIEVEWNITKGERRPDGVAKQFYLINDQFPGPLLEARSGDELVVRVRNLLRDDEGVAIHFHGVWASNEMDGVVGLTQCATTFGKIFTYQIRIDDNQAGTFWYHSHYETQRADGLYGPLVIHKPAYSADPELESYHYDEEQVLMIGDWYHRPAVEVLDSYMDWTNFKIEPAPDSMLLNGKGFFDCSMAVPARPVDCNAVKVPHLDLPSGRTRLRIINTGALAGFTFSMSGYVLALIKVDGGNDVQQSSEAKAIGVLYPGERIDVIIESLETAPHDSKRITVALDQENIRHSNTALTATQQFQISPEKDRDLPSVKKKTMDHLSERSKAMKIELQKTHGQHIPENSVPGQADKTFLLYSTISYLAINQNRPKGDINHTSWATMETRSLPLLAFPRDKWPSDPEPFIPATDGALWIDIVINNMDDKGHPFHLHGHDFYILASHSPSRVGAYDLYNPFDDSKAPAGGPMNLETPIKKDTVYVPSMGYVVLRFRGDSIGLWLLHCHIIWHQSVGMAMAFQVDDSASAEIWTSFAETAKNSCGG